MSKTMEEEFALLDALESALEGVDVENASTDVLLKVVAETTGEDIKTIRKRFRNAKEGLTA